MICSKCCLPMIRNKKNTDFKVGDWIIATAPMIVESYDMMGSGMKPDRSYMHRPLEVKAITQSHIVYMGVKGSLSDKRHEGIMPISEIEARKFIIAESVLVESAKESAI